MQKPARFLLHLFLSFALLAGSFIPARASAPAQSKADPLEPPPQRFSLMPGRDLLPASSPAAQNRPSAASWQVPGPTSCAVYSSPDTNSLEFDLYAYSPQTSQYLPVFITPVDEVEPHFNHGCTHILYTLAPPSPENEDLFLVNPDSSGLLRLTQNQGNNYNGAWSRDGSKIAFTSDRDGQPEIYTMNADGSNQVRLTYNAGDQFHNYDSMPAWSPDGTKIAFSSNRTGGYRIWVMDPDGSNPVQRSTQPYSFRPQWSPDGSTILFDAAYSETSLSFQNLYTMAANGSNPYALSINGTMLIDTDVLAEGWSPDGYDLYFSLITWVYISNKWYWTAAKSYFWSPQNNIAIVSLTPGDADWYPSGETYDTLPPVSSLATLPEFQQGTRINLQCTMEDPGGSGVFTNELDYRDAADTTWTELGECKPNYILGTSGHTYYFRARATDKVQNAEAWRGGIYGDTHTTVYDSRITGSVHDASGVPLAGTNPTFSFAPFLSYVAGRSGVFSDYFSTHYTYPFTVTWNNPAYGSLPPVYLIPNDNAALDAYLPPEDNILANPGFEGGSFSSSDWAASGNFMPTININKVHSGQYASQLGSLPAFATPKDFGTYANQIAVDANGTTYAAWSQAGILVYAWRSLDGVWSTPQVIPGAEYSVLNYFGVDAQFTVHVFYSIGNRSFYTCLPSGGTWLTPVELLNSPQVIPEGSDYVMSPDGHWYFVSQPSSQNNYQLFVTEVYNGQWSARQPIATVTDYMASQLAVSPDGTIGLIWLDDLHCDMCEYGNFTIFYAEKKSGSGWSAPQKITKDHDQEIGKIDLSFSVNGEPRLVWEALDFSSNIAVQIYFSHRSQSGDWSDPVLIDPVFTRDLPNDLGTAEGSDGAFYVTYRYGDWVLDQSGGNSAVMLTRRSPDGVWSSPAPLPWSTQRSQLTKMVIDSQNRLHFAWYESGQVGDQRISTINYACLQQNGRYVLGQPFSDTNSNLDPISQFIVGPDQTVHLDWQNYYSSFKMNSPAGDSTLSLAVTVPPASSNPGLSFVYQIAPTLLHNIQFSVQVKGAGITTATLFSAHEVTNGWAHQWLDMTSWAGKVVTLSFNFHQPAGFSGAAVNLDEVYLGSTHPDIWLDSTIIHALPGSQVTIPVDLGNLGRVPAADSRLTLALPAGVSFVSASVAPTIITPTLTWDFGDLPAQSDPPTLWVTLQMSASIPLGSSLPYSASISTASTELETANNTVSSVINASAAIYLPLLKR